MNTALKIETRVCRLFDEIVTDRLQLDLHGVNVITEAATGPFAVTAAIAAFAGARVTAIGADSPWGSFEQASAETVEIARACGVEASVTVVRREQADFSSARIVTNLGFVRPIDTNLISRMSFGSVIPLMYDSRELRRDEIDLSLCAARGISIVGTNEDHPLVDVLRYSGHLVVKMLLEEGREILRSRICLLGENLFTPHVLRSLQSLGADVIRARDWRDCVDCGQTLDALIYLDYWNRSGGIDAVRAEAWLRKQAGTDLIQFVGGLDLEPFKSAAWITRPDNPVPSQRMWRTLADLGVRPVIELHAAGLKAAELELKSVPHDAPGRLCGLRQAIGPVGTRTPATPILQTA